MWRRAFSCLHFNSWQNKFVLILACRERRHHILTSRMPHHFPHKCPYRNVGPLGGSALIVPKRRVLRTAYYCKPNAKPVTKAVPGPAKFRVRLDLSHLQLQLLQVTLPLIHSAILQYSPWRTAQYHSFAECSTVLHGTGGFIDWKVLLSTCSCRQMSKPIYRPNRRCASWLLHKDTLISGIHRQTAWAFLAGNMTRCVETEQRKSFIFHA